MSVRDSSGGLFDRREMRVEVGLCGWFQRKWKAGLADN
jgi:hypothetical protein